MKLEYARRILKNSINSKKILIEQFEKEGWVKAPAHKKYIEGKKQETKELQQAISVLELVQKGEPPEEVVEGYIKSIVLARMDPRAFLTNFFDDCFKERGE